MLPSADDLLAFIKGIKSDRIIVLPNNPNIIPTVRLADQQSSKQIYTLLTKNVVDGLTAMYGYIDSGSVSENIESMNDCIGLADTLEVFRSSRDATIGKVSIEKGDYFVVKDSEVLSTSAVLEEAVAAAAEKIDIDSRSNISLYYGDDFDATELGSVEERFSKMKSSFEFEHHHGGQENGLIIAIE